MTTPPTATPFSPQIEAYFEALAAKAAKRAVAEAFAGLGADITSPAGIAAEHADRAFIRSTRLGVREAKTTATTKVISLAVGAAIAAIGAAVWSVIKGSWPGSP